MLTWIRVDADLPRRPTSLDLCRTLRDRNAWGYLIRADIWCTTHAKDGVIRPVGNTTADQLFEFAAEWKGKKGRLAELAVSHGFLIRVGDSLEVADWWDKHGRELERLEKDRQRKRDESASNRGSSFRGNSAEAPEEFQRNPTKPNQTKPNQKISPPPPPPTNPPPPHVETGASGAVVVVEKEMLVRELNDIRARMRNVRPQTPDPEILDKFIEDIAEINGPEHVFESARYAITDFLEDDHWKSKRWPLNVFFKPGVWQGKLPDRSELEAIAAAKRKELEDREKQVAWTLKRIAEMEISTKQDEHYLEDCSIGLYANDDRVIAAATARLRELANTKQGSAA